MTEPAENTPEDGPEKSELLNRLEMFGDPRNEPAWAGGQVDYVSLLRLSAADVPELVAIAKRWLEPQDDWPDDPKHIAGFAPIHAWRCLAQLRAPETVAMLLEMLDPLSTSGDDWFSMEFPEAFGCFGEAAVGPLREYLADGAHRLYARSAVAGGLRCVAENGSRARDEAVKALREALSRFEETPPLLNGFILGDLLDLVKAEVVAPAEIAEVVERAYAADRVDLSVCGNWSEVRAELGVEGLGLVSDELANREYSILSSLGDDEDELDDDLDDGWDDDDDFGDEDFEDEEEDEARMRDYREHGYSVTAPIHAEPKVGRNDPCPCGSGKKYKKCCGK